MSIRLSKAQLTGLDESHLVTIGPGGMLAHQKVSSALSSIIKHANKDGIDLQPASGYRSFERQKAIWDAKLSGKRPLLDRNSKPLDVYKLSPQQKLDALLYWSAIPGTSRHHWGSDFDFYDPTAQGDRKFELIPEEYQPGGPQHDTYQWLKVHAKTYGFFWPYDRQRGGVAVEPWHLSYAEVSEPALAAISPDLIKGLLLKHPIELVGEVLERIDEMLEQYVFNVGHWNDKS